MVIEWGETFFSILIIQPFLFIVLILNAERIDIFSNKKLGIFHAAKGNALAAIGSLLVPGRVTELLKPIYYKTKVNLSISEGLSIVLLERIFDIFIVTLMLLGLALFMPTYGIGQYIPPYLLISIILAFTLLLILVAFYPYFFTNIIRIITRGRLRAWLIEMFDHFHKGLPQGLSIKQVLLTITVWFGSWLTYWIFLQFDGQIALSWSASLSVFLAATFGLALTITPGGIGTFEAIVSTLLITYGYTWESALISTIGLRIASFLPNLILALYTVCFEGFDLIMEMRIKAKSSGGLDE